MRSLQECMMHMHHAWCVSFWCVSHPSAIDAMHRMMQSASDTRAPLPWCETQPPTHPGPSLRPACGPQTAAAALPVLSCARPARPACPV